MKKLLALLLAFCLLTAVGVSALAADRTPSMDNFKRVSTYEPGFFPDIDENFWAYRTITSAYEFGFMNGKENGFIPEANITLAETLVIAARLHDIAYGGMGIFSQDGENWYDEYLFYCEENEIIGPTNGFFARPDASEMNEAIDRDIFCAIMYAAVPSVILAIEDQSRTVTFADADSINFSTQVNELAKYGIIGGYQGDDEAMYFEPANPITRAEVATIITRIVDLDLRIMPIN